MRLFLSIISILSIFRLVAQVDTINLDYSEFYSDHKKYTDGYYIIKKNGVKIKEFKLINQKAIGVCKDYYDNGNLKLISEFAYFQHIFCYNGIWKEYDESGKLKTEGSYRFADSIECISCYEPYHNNIKTKAYSHSERSGEWKEYHENGQVKAIGCYKGIHEINSTHIPKKMDGVFIPGDYFEEYLKDKYWKYYNEKGELIKEEYYFKGMLCDVKTYEK
jgi:antitoxin component YwqK of YwqJK toxin-antitoxin module